MDDLISDRGLPQSGQVPEGHESASSNLGRVGRGRVGRGNRLAVTHGASSARVVAARTEQIVAEWTSPEAGLSLLQPVDHAAIWATASAFAQLERLAEYLEGAGDGGLPRGIIDARGRERGCARLFLQTYSKVMAGLKDLGGTPGGRAGMAGGIAALRGAAEADAAQERLRRRHDGETR